MRYFFIISQAIKRYLFLLFHNQMIFLFLLLFHNPSNDIIIFIISQYNMKWRALYGTTWLQQRRAHAWKIIWTTLPSCLLYLRDCLTWHRRLSFEHDAFTKVFQYISHRVRWSCLPHTYKCFKKRLNQNKSRVRNINFPASWNLVESCRRLKSCWLQRGLCDW